MIKDKKIEIKQANLENLKKSKIRPVAEKLIKGLQENDDLRFLKETENFILKM